MKDREAWEDYLQDAYVELLPRGVPSPLAIAGRAKSREIDNLRRAKRRGTRPLPEEAATPRPGPEAEAIQLENDRLVREAVGRLPEDLRLPCRLHWFLGFGISSIAKEIDRPISTVHELLKRAKRRLRRELASIGP